MKSTLFHLCRTHICHWENINYVTIKTIIVKFVKLFVDYEFYNDKVANLITYSCVLSTFLERLYRWLTGQECILLLQRNRVQFLAPTLGESQLLYNSMALGSNTLFWTLVATAFKCTYTCMQIHYYVQMINNKRKL